MKATEFLPPYREMHVALDQNTEHGYLASWWSELDSTPLARYSSPQASPQKSRTEGPFPELESERNPKGG